MKTGGGSYSWWGVVTRPLGGQSLRVGAPLGSGRRSPAAGTQDRAGLRDWWDRTGLAL